MINLENITEDIIKANGIDSAQIIAEVFRDDKMPPHLVLKTGDKLETIIGEEAINKRISELIRFAELEDEEDVPCCSNDMDSDALDGCGTVRSWEEKNGRGFWGNPSTGFLTDDQVNDM